MLKPPTIQNPLGQVRLTWSESLLLGSAAVLSVGAFAEMAQAPLGGVVMLLAAVALAALVFERASTRRTLLMLAEQLDASDPVYKLEVEPIRGTSVLGQAFNRAIQRSRAEALEAPLPATAPHDATDTGYESVVAVLSVGLTHRTHAPYSAAYSERLALVAREARQACGDADVAIYAQADGTLALIFGTQQQPISRSLRQALEVALTLSARYNDVRFGLSCGQCRVCTLPGVGTTYIGTPLEDAVRLARMAIAWHEYRLLCAEPIALLARSFASQRTTLELTHAATPTLPVYALTLEPSRVAVAV